MAQQPQIVVISGTNAGIFNFRSTKSADLNKRATVLTVYARISSVFSSDFGRG